jgi:hypothetical protein
MERPHLCLTISSMVALFFFFTARLVDSWAWWAPCRPPFTASSLALGAKNELALKRHQTGFNVLPQKKGCYWPLAPTVGR